VWIFTCHGLVQEGGISAEHLDQVVLDEHMTSVIRSVKHTSCISIVWIFSNAASKVQDPEKCNEIAGVGIMFDITETVRRGEKGRYTGLQP
jgi:hypothetical protein